MNWSGELNQILSAKAKKIIHVNRKNQIVLYGAGSLGNMALDFLETINVKPKYIVDKNFQGTLRDIEVISPFNVDKNDLSDVVFIVCIATIPIKPLVSFLEELGCKKIIHFYDYARVLFKEKMNNGWYYPEPNSEDIESIKHICEVLEHDENSLCHYLQFLWWRLRRVEKSYEQYPVLSSKKFFKAPCIPKLSIKEKFLDAGAHFGGSLEKFLEVTSSDFEYAWLFEPDEKNLNILKSKVDKLCLGDKVDILDMALSDRNTQANFMNNLGFASKISKYGQGQVTVKTVDSFELDPTIIKLHVEGNELEVLCGATKTIKKHSPIIMVLADHNEDGLYKIALFLIELKEYKIYFYLHDYCGNSAVFYAIPRKRKYA